MNTTKTKRFTFYVWRAHKKPCEAYATEMPSARHEKDEPLGAYVVEAVERAAAAKKAVRQALARDACGCG